MPAPGIGQRERPRPGSIAELLRLFGKLGVIGFGGPTAHIALFEDEIVSKRGWISRDQFVDALAATNIIPGPNSTEMAVHVGYRRAGVPGAIVAGATFIAPAFLMMIALSWAYFRWSGVAAISDVFDGIKPAVIAVIVVTLWRLFKSSVRDVPQLGLMAAAGALAYAFTAWEPLILIAAGLAGVALYARADATTRGCRCASSSRGRCSACRWRRRSSRGIPARSAVSRSSSCARAACSSAAATCSSR